MTAVYVFEVILGTVLTVLFLPAWELDLWKASLYVARRRWLSITLMLLCFVLDLAGIVAVVHGGGSLWLNR